MLNALWSKALITARSSARSVRKNSKHCHRPVLSKRATCSEDHALRPAPAFSPVWRSRINLFAVARSSKTTISTVVGQRPAYSVCSRLNLFKRLFYFKALYLIIPCFGKGLYLAKSFYGQKILPEHFTVIDNSYFVHILGKPIINT